MLEIRRRWQQAVSFWVKKDKDYSRRGSSRPEDPRLPKPRFKEATPNAAPSPPPCSKLFGGNVSKVEVLAAGTQTKKDVLPLVVHLPRAPLDLPALGDTPTSFPPPELPLKGAAPPRIEARSCKNADNCPQGDADPGFVLL